MSCTRGCCESFREHVLSLRFGADSTKTLSNGFPKDQDTRDGKDMDAYKRLKANGLQPPRWRGSAALEAGATTSLEVERGTVLGPKLAKAFQASADDV
jgi:hypothetical protein